MSFNNFDIEDTARMMESLALVMQESTERGNLAPETYSGAFELLGAMAAAIREKAGCAA